MTETYQDILDEIENLSSVSKGGISCPIQLYADSHSIEGACEGADDCGIKVLKHLAERVHDAVACDMNEWYQLDKNGEPVHIGDRVSTMNDGVRKVGGFSLVGEGIEAVPAFEYAGFSRGSHGWDFSSAVEKANDNLKYISEDLTKILTDRGMDKTDAIGVAFEMVKRVYVLAKEGESE